MPLRTQSSKHRNQKKRSFSCGTILRSVVSTPATTPIHILRMLAAITRAFTLIYTLALLTLLTRIQLNLLGRRSYLSSVVSLATGGVEQSTISLENHDDDNQDQAYGSDF